MDSFNEENEDPSFSFKSNVKEYDDAMKHYRYLNTLYTWSNNNNT